MAQRKKTSKSITASSTAEYFAKNLQQVGFSSPTKAVLTTLKEAVDNSLDACEDAGILPDLVVDIEKKGPGHLKNSDLIRVRVEDNGPGLEFEDVSRVFGEYLASSKFGRGRCSRGQQGIGISAATTWAQLTNAKGAYVITKTKRMRQAIACNIEVDIKNNKGVVKNKQSIKWDRTSGVVCEFLFDGRIQLNGEGGILTYLNGTSLLNPHMQLKYRLPGEKWKTVERVSKELTVAPAAIDPHPHTMKLGEFIHHAHLFGKKTVRVWLRKGFSRVSDGTIKEFIKNGLDKKLVDKVLNKVTDQELKAIFNAVQKTELMSPSTRSVMRIGEESLAKSIRRMGEIDFFSVVSRRQTICDAKPVSVEIAIARLAGQKTPVGSTPEEGAPVTVLRFANRVPLQFDKASCAMYRSIVSVNWRSYGLSQPRGGVPQGPYVMAVSLVSPFIKFKNASKETVDASDELVEEVRRALMQGGQRLSRHIKKENREAQLEQKMAHIEQFCPVLIQCLCRITNAPAKRKKNAEEGLMKILGRDVNVAKASLKEASKALDKVKGAGKLHSGKATAKEVSEEKLDPIHPEEIADVDVEVSAPDSEPSPKSKSKKSTKTKKITKSKKTKAKPKKPAKKKASKPAKKSKAAKKKRKR